MSNDTRPGLGRKPHWDPANEQYKLEEKLALKASRTRAKKLTPTNKLWAKGATLDQGQLGACTGFGWVDALSMTPQPRLDKSLDTDDYAIGYYSENTRLDNIAGEYPPTDGGSSVLAGAKNAQGRGFISEYHWAQGPQAIQQIILTIAHIGPVVVGTDWLDGMFDPRPSGLLDVSGSVEGGHCFVLRGVALSKTLRGESGKMDLFRIANSWGTSWGLNGDAWIKCEDFANLMNDNGEACLATKAKTFPAVTK